MSLAGHGGWAGVLTTLTAGGDLSQEATNAAMREMLTGQASPAQIAGVLVGLRCKGETTDELVGLLAAMREAASVVPLDAQALGLIDTCGTGGDGSHSINVSTIAALVAAGAGARVCKHGNRAISSRCGSADVLEALGVVVDLDAAGVARCITEAGIGFCLAPRFHPAMRHVGPTRRELGVPTVFNYLGPLANPAGVRRQIVGVNDPAMARRLLEVLARTGSERVMVVHGAGGLDEFSTLGPSEVVELRDGQVRQYTVDPAELDIAQTQPTALAGGDAAENAEAVLAVLAGQTGPHRDIAVLNAAAALQVAGLAEQLADGMAAAAAAIDDGRARRTLDALVATSRNAAERKETGSG